MPEGAFADCPGALADCAGAVTDCAGALADCAGHFADCAGLLFQFPGLLLASAAGIGAANFLKDPAPWLQCATSGGQSHSLKDKQRKKKPG